jgi:tRNA threonylcarbamoyladenosine biosynthesis protein TsaB
MTVRCELVSDEERWLYEWQADRTLARDMLGYLRDRLAEHGATLDSLSGIGVYRGPGSYTGLRIGLTVLNTIAATQQIPIVGGAGQDWRHAALERLQDNQSDSIVLPEYGGEARVTQPRK